MQGLPEEQRVLVTFTTQIRQRQAGREYAEAILRAEHEIKVDTVGPERQDPKAIKILGRIITYTEQGLLV